MEYLVDLISSYGILERFLDHFFEISWSILAILPRLMASWSHVGAFWGHLLAIWGHVGSVRAGGFSGDGAKSLGRMRVLSFLALFWYFLSILSHLRACWSHFVAIFGPCRDYLGAVWGNVGFFLALRWEFGGALGAKQ